MPKAPVSNSPKKQVANALRLRNAGDIHAAIEQLRKLVRQAPRHLDGNFFLGTFLAESGNLVEGRRFLSKARDLNPHSVQVLNNLGNLLRMMGEMDEALTCYRQTVAIDPAFVHGWVNLGFVYSGLERWQESLDSFRRVAGESSGDMDILLAMATASRKLGDVDGAIRLYEVVLKLDPADRRGIALILAELRGDPMPDRQPAGMVTETYREKAADWDRNVTRPGDSYFGPEHVLRLVRPHLADGAALTMLDLGCGTGNCGNALAPFAARLVGVDLSPEMLQQAKLKACYDELVEDEIGHYLATARETFDVILGAGVFIMFSYLDGVLAAVTERLKPGGLFALTLYRSPEADIEIRHNQHFGHSRAYLERTIAQSWLQAIEIAEVIHETADGEDQPGFAVLLRRPP